MSQAQHIELALKAADNALMLQSSSDMIRAAKVWHRRPLLGLDTEFVRERTYHANLGLVQISDGQTVWLVDPLALDSLEPLADLLRDPDIQKIFHSPSEDLEVLQYAVGALPEPLIDTQTACALLGKPLQMGYHTAVEWLLGLTVDKEQTRSNWCARPLRNAQLHYAALDVCLLPMMWSLLEEKLAKLDRLEWFREDCNRQLERARNPVPTDQLWQRIRGAGRLDGLSLTVLQALAGWREQQAIEKNRPRGFIVPDPILLAIADRKLRTAPDLERLEGLHPRAAKRYADSICTLVNQVLDSGNSLKPLENLSNVQRKLLNRMRDRVHAKAAELQLDPAVLAPKRELEELIFNPDRVPERLQGWRMDEITCDLVDLVKKG